MKMNSMNILKGITVITLIFLFNSCKKSNDTQPVSSGYTWTYDGVNYRANIDSAYLVSMNTTGHIILAGTGTSMNSLGTGPRIVVSSFNVGTYSLTGINMVYVNSLGDLEAGTGSINITSSSADKLSGNLTATTTDSNGINHTLTGTLTDVPITY